MDASFLTYEGIATDPFKTHLNLTKPVYILGKHFKPDEHNFFFLQKKKKSQIYNFSAGHFSGSACWEFC